MLGLASTKAMNNKLEVCQEKKAKNRKVKRKAEKKSMIAKQYKTREGMSLSNTKKNNKNTRKNINPIQAKDKYLFQL